MGKNSVVLKNETVPFRKNKTAKSIPIARATTEIFEDGRQITTGYFDEGNKRTIQKLYKKAIIAPHTQLKLINRTINNLHKI